MIHVVLCFRGKMSRSVGWLLVAISISSYAVVTLAAVTCLDNNDKPVDWSVEKHC